MLGASNARQDGGNLGQKRYSRQVLPKVSAASPWRFFMLPPQPFQVQDLRTLVFGMKGADVRWLHVLLNYHLPAPYNLLPITGGGAEDFGPKTLQSVKRFQEVNRIDKGTPDYMDGRVGPHTWEALHTVSEVRSNLIVAPAKTPPAVTPSVTPNKTPEPPTPAPAAPTPPAVQADGMVQGQAGETVLIPFKGKASESQGFQIGVLVLGKADGSTSQTQLGYLGSVDIFSKDLNRTRTSGVFASWQTQNLPSPWKRLTWTAQVQEAITNSVTGGAAFTTEGLVNANLSLVKNKNGDDVVQLTGQGGLFMEVDTPSKSSSHWAASGGGLGFIGFTLTYYSYPGN
jgi:hypothetical protein